MKNEFLNELMDNLASLFGHNCEVVLHDFSNGVEQSVVKIVNGHVTNRQVGACATNLGLEHFLELDKSKKSVYFTTTPYGQVLKCCSTLIRDDEGKPIGGLCINYDITDVVRAQKALSSIVERDVSSSETNEEHYQNVNQLLEHYLQLAEKIAGMPAAEMDKKSRMKALAFLDEKGILQISKASNRLCEFFGISRFTLYSYLDEIRKDSEN